MNISRDRITRFFFSRKGMITAISISLLIFLIFLIQTYGKAYRVDGYDFTSYLLSAKAMLNGTNPYLTGSPFPYIYPQFLSAILIPLAILPYWFSNLIWYLGNAVALYFSISILLKLNSGLLSYKKIAVFFFIPLIILTNVIQNNLLNGQVNFIVLLLCVLFFKYHLESRKLVAGVFLAAAIAIKLTPLILLIYLILRKEFLWAAVVLIISSIFIIGLPYAINGPVSLEWYSAYINSFVSGPLSGITQSSASFDYSITSIIRFLFPYVPIILSFTIAGVIALLPICLIQLELQRKKLSIEKSTKKQSLLFSLYMLAILLISPMCETHHLVNLFPALSLLVLAIFMYSGRHWRNGLIVLAITFVSLIASKSFFAINIAAVISLYIYMAWMFFQPFDKRTEFNIEKE